MEFRNRVKNRKFKRFLNHIVKLFKLRSLNFNTPQKIVLFGIIFNFIALFLPWVSSLNSSLSYNSFSKISGNIGIIIILLIILLLFNLFSINSKEKLQLHTKIHFKDYSVTIILGFFIFLLSILSINFINAMQFFSSIIIYGSGVILSITASIVILIGGMLQRKKFNKFSTTAKFYKNNNNDEIIEKNEKKNNMKLPF